MTIREQALLNRLRDAWADIRSYGTGMWQVSGICLAVLGLTFNALSGTLPDGVTPIFFTWGGFGLLLFASVIVLFTQFQLVNFRIYHYRRTWLIKKLEDELGVSDFPLKDHSAKITSRAGLREFYYVFLILGLVLAIITGWQLYTILGPVLISLILSGTVIIALCELMIGYYWKGWNYHKHDELANEEVRTN